jgi:hypothetical protein
MQRKRKTTRHTKSQTKAPQSKTATVKFGNSIPEIEPAKRQAQFGENVFSSFGCLPFGSDNQLPNILAQFCRKSPVHRGIINRKREFIAGANWTTENEALETLLNNFNSNGEGFSNVIKKLTLDLLFSGNGWLEIVTNAKRTFLNVFHHDYTTCRLSIDKSSCIISKDWLVSDSNRAEIPIYPKFVTDGDNQRSIIHIKDYEPEFENYGIPSWIAGLNVVAIGYKTDRWNVSRLDNSVQPSGVFVLSGTFNSDEEAESLVEDLQEEFSGEDSQGKVIFVAQDAGGKESKFIPLELKFDGDWVQLDENSMTKLIAAHSWYRALTSLPGASGFDTERILNEWEMAKITTIEPFQRWLISEIFPAVTQISGIETSDFQFLNKPPINKAKPDYMKVWEARRSDGLDYDQKDPEQQIFLARLKNKVNG